MTRRRLTMRTINGELRTPDDLAQGPEPGQPQCRRAVSRRPAFRTAIDKTGHSP